MIECIPNISEGRDRAVIERICAAIESVKGVCLLHRDVSVDAHRSVLTIVGGASELKEAALRMYEVALSSIDMRRHEGVHPRIGAVDVCPFVPLQGGTRDEAIELAKSLGKELASRHNIPVFLYEQSAQADYRRRLYDIRRGQFEGLGQKFQDNMWKPDFGPAVAHPSFGATVLGARDFLVAFNVSLKSDQVAVARQIARVLRAKRHSSNPDEAARWSAVRAIGWAIRSYSCVQVSTNIVDTRRIGPLEVFRAIHDLAHERGVEVLGSELVGLIPERVLLPDPAMNPPEVIEELMLSYHKPFDLDERVLERAMRVKLGKRLS